MKRIMLLALVLGVLFLPASSWAVNIVANPGFESGDFTSWTVTNNTNPSLTIVECGTPNTGACNASFGEFVPPGSFIEQDLATVAGQSYVLSFWLSNGASAEPPGSPNHFEVVWGGGLLSFSVDNIAAQPYTLNSFNVTATGTTTNLKFGFLNDLSFFRLDDVSVEGPSAVPEPGAFQLTLIGAAMISAAWRFRRRRI